MHIRANGCCLTQNSCPSARRPVPECTNEVPLSLPPIWPHPSSNLAGRVLLNGGGDGGSATAIAKSSASAQVSGAASGCAHVRLGGAPARLLRQPSTAWCLLSCVLVPFNSPQNGGTAVSNAHAGATVSRGRS